MEFFTNLCNSLYDEQIRVSKCYDQSYKNDYCACVTTCRVFPDLVTYDPRAPWYSPVPVGKHILNVKLAEMCALAGSEGRVTNHRLRATSATHMYEQDIPEKGHSGSNGTQVD